MAWDPTAVLGGLGLAVAATGVIFARRTAKAAHRQASLASEASHEHSRPNVVIDEVRVGSDVRLVVTNCDLRTLDSVHIELVAAQCTSGPHRRTWPLSASQTWSSDRVERFRSVQLPISTVEVPDGCEALVLVEAVQGRGRWAWTVAVPHSSSAGKPLGTTW